MDRWDVVLKDYPAGNGYKNIIYFSQSMLNENEWLRFDYGIIKNMEKYGTARPPSVPLEQLSIPTGLFVGSLDKLATY